MKKLMILGGSELQLPGILKAKEMGLEVIVCDYYVDCVGKQVEGIIPELVSTYDYEAVLEAAKRHNIDGITTLCTDYPMRIVGYVAETLGLPGITKEIAVNATDKGKMREIMRENNVPSPLFEIVDTEEAYLEAVKKFTDGFVLKAVDNSGSRGIQLVKDITDEKIIREAFTYCKEFSRSGDLIIEEYMAGPEVCVETLNFGGKCYPIQITAQLPKQPPYFTDAGYYQPADYDDKTMNEIADVAVRANLALNNHTGSSCTEIIVTKDGPKVVEVGPRLAGDYMTTHLVPLSTGVDMVEGIIKIALGETPDITKKFDRGSSVKYYMKETIGEITEIKGIEEASKMEGVVLASMMKKVGDMAVPLRSSNDRLGFVITEGANAEEAVKFCDAALSKIEVITKQE